MLGKTGVTALASLAAHSQTAYSITVAVSINLHQQGDEIHKRYNKRVRSLASHIDRSFARAGSEAR